jgi:hypothetical protein
MNTGYSKIEIDEIQHRWKLTFPPDLVALLRNQRPLGEGAGAFDWLTSSGEDIQGRLDWPFDSFLFDVEHDQLWWPEWGPRPESAHERRERLAKAFAEAPMLIPLFGHRYLPAEPREAGNPVFSVYQSDVIYYGANLQDWLRREFGGWDADAWPPIKRIRFWFEAVERNG